ncbi:intermembrane phospholipid transport protein YdbH family protein [Coraliomargarita parva]|uniref:intermembrane phospholipid transport protein YdbH family protein n=1 Tax=Coraliomargarita parva TaxID=3014050 RepID=UPI0022B5D5C6|nr:YdbH domain-containing protein [Coraliomargarita parva]
MHGTGLNRLIRLVLIGFILLGLGLFLCLWQLPSLLQWALQPYLQARQAQCAIERIGLSLQGFEVQMAWYREPGLELEQLQLSGTWLSLAQPSLPTVLDVRCARVLWHLPDGEAAEPGSADLTATIENLLSGLPAQVAQVSALMGELPALMLTLDLSELELRRGEQTIPVALRADLEHLPAGVTSLVLELTGAGFHTGVMLKRIADEPRLGVDYTLGIEDIPGFLDRMIPGWEASLLEEGVELYFDPIDGHSGMMEASGYLRWSGATPEELMLTLLANTGPLEFFAPEADGRSPGTGLGLALSAPRKFRVYLDLPFDSLRYRGWNPGEAHGGVTLSDHGLGLVFTAETNRISLEQTGGRRFDALEGTGSFLAEVTTPKLDASLLRALTGAKFEGWIMDAGAEAAMTLQLEDWKLNDLTGHGAVVLRSGKTEALALESVQASFKLDAFSGDFPSGAMELKAGKIDAAGAVIDDMQSRIRIEDTGEVYMDGLETSILGGRLEVEPLHFSIQPQSWEIDSQVRLDQIDLDALASMVPQFKGRVQGRVSGSLDLAWRDGLILAGGNLRLPSEQSTAHLSYPVEGLLTGGMSPQSSGYEQYRMAEKALGDLTISRFDLQFFPGGSEHKPVQLKFVGESLQDNTRVPLDFTLNVNAQDTTRLLRLLQVMQQGDLQFSY